MSGSYSGSAPIPGNGPPVLRDATLHDVPALRRIRREAISRLAASMLGVQAAFEWAESAGPDRERRAVEDHLVTVAEVGQRLAGWVETFNDAVEGLYVDPDHASRGVGHLLMQHAEEQIRLAGFKAVLLHASRNAEEFYQTCGYRPVGPRSPDVGLPMKKVLT